MYRRITTSAGGPKKVKLFENYSGPHLRFGGPNRVKWFLPEKLREGFDAAKMLLVLKPLHENDRLSYLLNLEADTTKNNRFPAIAYSKRLSNQILNGVVQQNV